MTARSPLDFTVLVVAKAPVPGLAKTRLCPPLPPAGAADVAAAALLDTLHLSARAVGGDRRRVVVSMTGNLPSSARHADLLAAMVGCHVIEQRGDTFGQRLRHAHHDAAVLGEGTPVVQIGMDTPHADPTQLIDAATGVSGRDGSAAVGDAKDGGWWLLALADPAAACALEAVPMSQPDTGALTRSALAARGLTVIDAAPLADVDTWQDAVAVAATHPNTRFADAVRRQVSKAGEIV